MAQSTTPKMGHAFSIGICASDSAPSLAELIGVIEGEVFMTGFELARIIIVASGCPRMVIAALEEQARSDPRIVLLTESERRGKVEAINQIRQRAVGEFLVMINSDAVPSKGSISNLLTEIAANPSIGSASARPVFRAENGPTKMILELMWSAHNISSLELNHQHLSNHNCDELMAVRSRLMPRLPEQVVNDGAYIGGYVFSRGYRILFSEKSTVRIDVPTRISHLIQQRRRILFGHAQVWRALGRPPRTVESLLVMKPRLAVKLMAKVIRRRPSLLLILPVAAVTETIAASLAMSDRTISSRRHLVWRRYRS
jgi:cellulose synthase/poly-beta-1,6-N-acetylglucosamine synthase-like glycosyltransferase